MMKSAEDYLAEPYTRLLIPAGDGTYTAEVLEFPGCVAQGSSPATAYRQLEKAAKSWIEASIDQGLEIPEPILNQGYAGKVALRLPRSLHRQAARLANRDQTSLNTFLVSAVAARVGAEQAYEHLVQRLEDKLEQMMAVSTTNIILHMPLTIQHGVQSSAGTMNVVNSPFVKTISLIASSVVASSRGETEMSSNA